MSEAIGQVLSFAVGVAISPLPIVAVVLMLATPRGRTNGLAFMLGWIVGLALVGTIVLLIASGASASKQGGPATWVSWLEIVLGALSVLMAGKQWRDRPRGSTTGSTPGWMRAIDRFTAVRSTAVAIALSGINPKNLLLTVGAAAAIAQTGVSAGRQAVALAVFVVIGTVGVGAPVAIYFGMGDRSARLLGELRGWMTAHNAAIMAVLLLVIGAKLIGDGVSSL